LAVLLRSLSNAREKKTRPQWKIQTNLGSCRLNARGWHLKEGHAYKLFSKAIQKRGSNKEEARTEDKGKNTPHRYDVAGWQALLRMSMEEDAVEK